VLFSLLTLVYAACDFEFNPTLRYEAGFSMRPDLSRIPELFHWGGRLYCNGAWTLLVSNALVLGGMGALIASGAISLYRRLQPAADHGQTVEG
jgi:hypothetical protein